MENLETKDKVEDVFIATSEIKNYLMEAARWGKFLAIMGYIGLGFMVLAAIVMVAGFSHLGNMTGVNLPMSGMGVFYVLLALVYYFPITYLFKFSSKMRAGLATPDNDLITAGFRSLKSMFKFMGIITIVILSIYVLAMIVIIPLSLMFM